MTRHLLRDLFNVPNSLSIARILVTPLLPVCWFTLDSPALGLMLGLFVGITDLFDGVIARKLNQVTEIGALLDQLGDLIFESTVLLIAVVDGRLWMGWLLFYLFREFLVSTVRIWVNAKGASLPSSWIGKAKSSLMQYGFFLFFLGAILTHPSSTPDVQPLLGISPGLFVLEGGTFSIVLGILVGLYSGAQYLRSFAAIYENQRSVK
ncbi:MAG: CDP-alcohol phosphatidyltransferase family protein [Proteobacteria bacterium]|nr:CDP-alcohol phosphatidyltransferase family protein [Pseudomonadota bacterium]